MRRHLLPLVTLGLLVLLLVDRVSHALAGSHAQPDSATTGLTPAARDLRGAEGASAAAALKRQTRLAARQKLTREAANTYLDSLLVTTDSVLRRWPDRFGGPLRVAILEGELAGYDPRMAGFVRSALQRWESTGVGFRFTEVTDTTGADIIFRWIDHFTFDRAGQTDLTWDQSGRVRRAQVSLAIRTSTGYELPDTALLAVAVHETGHALGLPHSPDSADVMFPATRTGTLSQRDRRTVSVLYRLPPGPLRDGVARY